MESLEPKGPPRLGSMKRHRTTLCTLALAGDGSCVLAPAAAMAGGPLLSGYGGPGGGAQAIIGATLLNGPGSGSGGGGSGGSSSGGGSGSSSAGSASLASRSALRRQLGGERQRTRREPAHRPRAGAAGMGVWRASGATGGAHPRSSLRAVDYGLRVPARDERGSVLVLRRGPAGACAGGRRAGARGGGHGDVGR